MDDWESFIADVENSAPKVRIDEERHRCQECDTVLENIEGEFICPACSVQATNILQLEETEIHCDESGRIFLGQAVNLFAKKSRRQQIDYGWAWSTDDAIVHILNLQIESLEKHKLVPEHFRASISNMWLKYWLENVAPFIRDEYNEHDLTPLKTTNCLKTRDIEVLIKVQDKVMIPQWACRNNNVKNGKEAKRKRSYAAIGARFYKRKSSGNSESDDMDDQVEDKQYSAENADMMEDVIQPQDSVQQDLNKLRPKANSTRNLTRDNVNILTLNRTLAFIEATARLIDMPEPLFAADIIRACTQRLIPFFGAHKSLPENMRINCEDRLLFKVTSPPSANQLTRATSLLIHKVYRDKFPLQAPVPNIVTIFKRFIEDMNLPNDILEHLDGVDFSSFKKTSQVNLPENKPPTLQHYDRWAFAILISQLKKMFTLDEESLLLQSEQVRNNFRDENYFIASDWLRQLSIRLKLIMTYDPYVLNHPLANIRDLAPTDQMFNYIEINLGDKCQSTTRLFNPLLRNDSTLRSELTDFLKHEIPKPQSLTKSASTRSELEEPLDLRRPLLDSFRRTQHLWLSTVENNADLLDLIFKDFTHQKILLPNHGRRWSIYETSDQSNLKLDLSPEWPYFFRLLLHVGGFICFCDPRDLLREVRFVEEHLFAGARAKFKLRNLAIRNAQRNKDTMVSGD